MDEQDRFAEVVWEAHSQLKTEVHRRLEINQQDLIHQVREWGEADGVMEDSWVRGCASVRGSVD
jgi:hypothetical protein